MAKLIVLIASNDDSSKQEVRHVIEQQPYRVVFWECGNGLEALRYINALQPDLVIMDVLLSGKSGFEVIESAEHTPAVIFISDSAEHAAKAFEHGATDYLLKPLSIERTTRALSRFERAQAGITPEIQLFNPQQATYPTRILVEKGNRLTSIPVDKITHLKADKDYTWIHMFNGESYLSTNGIGQLERKLDSRRFIRVHRSYIINIDHIQELYRDISKLFVALPNDIEINVGRVYMPVLKELMF